MIHQLGVYSIKKKFQNHQSILKIKEILTDLFPFQDVTDNEIQKEISKLDSSKAISVGDIL